MLQQDTKGPPPKKPSNRFKPKTVEGGAWIDGFNARMADRRAIDNPHIPKGSLLSQRDAPTARAWLYGWQAAEDWIPKYRKWQAAEPSRA